MIEAKSQVRNQIKHENTLGEIGVVDVNGDVEQGITHAEQYALGDGSLAVGRHSCFSVRKMYQDVTLPPSL